MFATTKSTPYTVIKEAMQQNRFVDIKRITFPDIEGLPVYEAAESILVTCQIIDSADPNATTLI